MILIKSHFITDLKCIDVCEESIQSDILKRIIISRTGLPPDEISLFCNGFHLSPNETIPNGSSVHVTLTLPGGKGGFGSMLRAIGAQIEKTTNREACRDLSGRRLRDINEEQRLKKWIAKQAEREEATARRKKEKLERLRAVPKHEFNDPEYERRREEMPERIKDVVSQGLQALSEQKATELKSSKRKVHVLDTSSKKFCMWSGVDFDGDLSDLSSGESDSECKSDYTLSASNTCGSNTNSVSVEYKGDCTSSASSACGSNANSVSLDSNNIKPIEQASSTEKTVSTDH